MQRGILHLAIAGMRAVRLPVAVEQQFEPVAAMDVALQVEAVGKEPEHIQHDPRRRAFLDAVGIEAGLDLAPDRDRFALKPALALEGLEGAVQKPADTDLGMDILLHAQPGKRAGGSRRAAAGQRQDYLFADLEPAQVHDAGKLPGGAMRVPGMDAGPGEHGDQRLALADFQGALDRRTAHAGLENHAGGQRQIRMQQGDRHRRLGARHRRGRHRQRGPRPARSFGVRPGRGGRNGRGQKQREPGGKRMDRAHSVAAGQHETRAPARRTDRPAGQTAFRRRRHRDHACRAAAVSTAAEAKKIKKTGPGC